MVTSQLAHPPRRWIKIERRYRRTEEKSGHAKERERWGTGEGNVHQDAQPAEADRYRTFQIMTERQTVQRDHGRDLKIEERHQLAQTIKDHVSKQPQIPRKRHREGRQWNQQPDAEHRIQSKHQQNESKHDAQPQDEKLGRQDQLLSQTCRIEQRIERSQTQQRKQDQNWRDQCHPEWHCCCSEA